MQSLKNLLSALDVDMVLDVGANKGQFVEFLRKVTDFGKTIYSFEPLSSAFVELQNRARSDPSWNALNYALGYRPGKAVINVSQNSHSSSLLPVKPWALEEEPLIRYTDSEEIEISTIDQFLVENNILSRKIFLKVDTQGFEFDVIRGALSSLDRLLLIQLELSLKPVYEGEKNMEDVMKLLRSLGYHPIEISKGWHNSKSHIWHQADVLFLRDDVSERVP